MTYRDKIMQLSVGKVVKVIDHNFTFYGHVVGFENDTNYSFDTGIVVRLNDGKVTVDLDDIYL
jgi:hypothetical protein